MHGGPPWHPTRAASATTIEESRKERERIACSLFFSFPRSAWERGMLGAHREAAGAAADVRHGPRIGAARAGPRRRRFLVVRRYHVALLPEQLPPLGLRDHQRIVAGRH